MSSITESVANIRLSDLITLAIAALVLISLVRSAYSLYLRKSPKKLGVEVRRSVEVKKKKVPKDYEPIVPIYAEYYRPNGVMYRMHRRLRRNRS